jgi:hypothetical protein
VFTVSSTASPSPVTIKLLGLLGERVDDELDVLALVDAQLLDAAANLLAVHLGGEGGRLQLLANGLRGHALDPGRADQGAGGHEAG